jgi:hypothetical protein
MADIIDEANDKAEQHFFQCIALARSSLPTRAEEGEDIIRKECGDKYRPQGEEQCQAAEPAFPAKRKLKKDSESRPFSFSPV